MYFIKQEINDETLKREYELVECEVYDENKEYIFIQVGQLKICFPKDKTNTSKGFLFTNYNDALKRFSELKGRDFFD